ncbi:DNA polymerase [Ktedonospora formicarum]|uniref:DNA polymerase I n=1 Tax=Ktedonospora formicarum TaxID=2778364 RepID=A0A8J3I036_9CHLR|nr:DNA polymerase [Ktedonospora formicarum]GHO45151.1 hypothetical protein KSX_33140 [Ktedonospora formicarum]
MQTQLETYTLIDSVDDLIQMVQSYASRPTLPVAFDTETTGLSFIDDRLISLQFMQFGYMPVIVDVRMWSRQAFLVAGQYLADLFNDLKVVGMNLSFDWKFVRRCFGVSIAKCYDVMLAEQVILGLGKTGGRQKGIEFNLKAIAARYGLEVSKEERNIFIGMDKHPELWYAPFSEKTLLYMAQDVEVLENIVTQQTLKLRDLKLGHTVNLEHRALPAVASIEYNGIHVNEPGWREVIDEKAALATGLGEKAIEVFGEAIVRVRARRFRGQMQKYKQWKNALEAEEARIKAAFEATGQTKGWGEFKKREMAEFRELYPNPGVPKLLSHSPYAEWLIERDRHYKSAVEQYTAEERECSLEEYTDAMMGAWEQKHQKPDEDEYLNTLHKNRNLCYEPINLGSVPQMLDAFTELKIPLQSTSADALADLPEGMYPEVDLLKEWRAAQMFPTKFGDNLLAKIHPVTRRIYPSAHQIGADTGRSSFFDPPWQQIPSKTADGKRLRACVVAMAGFKLITSDYPNIELRILADLSGDRNMLKFFADGVDLHSATARMMFGLGEGVDVRTACVPGTGVSYRQVAKTINFGLVYGMSAAKLARTLKITKEKAQELMDKYFALYPGVVQWLKRQRALGTSNFYSTTVSGRKRFYGSLPDRRSKDYNKIRSAIERRACNSPIQGSSADITKLALALAYERLPEAAKIVAVVHDEIVLEAPEGMANECAVILAQAMKESCLKYLKRVHIPDFEVAISDHWEH